MSARATCMYCGASGIGPTMAGHGMCFPCWNEYQLRVREEAMKKASVVLDTEGLMATPGGRDLISRDVIRPRQARIEDLLAE